VEPERNLDAVLRAIGEANARLALVANEDVQREGKVLGVITERTIAELAYATARISD